MSTKRFYMVGSVVALAMVAFFIALYVSGPTGAKSTLATQPSANMLTETTPTVPADKTSEQSQNDDQVTGTTPQTGVPAIVPSNLNASADTPAFTEQDVRDYALTHNSRGFFKIDAIGPSPQLTSIKFDTLSALERDLNRTLDVQAKPDVLLCAVSYDGNFVVSSPFSAVLHYSHVVQVFDAHTGNLMTQFALNDK